MAGLPRITWIWWQLCPHLLVGLGGLFFLGQQVGEQDQGFAQFGCRRGDQAVVFELVCGRGDVLARRIGGFIGGVGLELLRCDVDEGAGGC